MTAASIRAAFDHLPANLRGALWVMMAALLLTIMGAMVKDLARDIHSFQIVFFRCLLGGIALFPFILRVGISSLKTQRPGLHVARVIIGTAAMFCVFFAFSHMPLAEAIAIVFSRPLFAMALAIPFLGEIVGWRRAAAALIGFIGVLIMIRPGTAAFQPASLVALAGAVMAGSIAIIVKKMAPTEKPDSIVMWFAIGGTLISAIPAALVWVWPTPVQWGWLIAIGITGIAGQAALMRGFSTGETSFVTPFDYTRLVFATVFGIVLFAEFPDFWKAVGALIIVGSGYYIARREIILARATGKPPPKPLT
ncbi:MAG: drug/metabolite transporter (DMT)-like permease [Alphaproteobacteria bacterium]|jgi:drug/metabolite transporter (DMT)-like permease